MRVRVVVAVAFLGIALGFLFRQVSSLRPGQANDIRWLAVDHEAVYWVKEDYSEDTIFARPASGPAPVVQSRDHIYHLVVDGPHLCWIELARTGGQPNPWQLKRVRVGSSNIETVAPVPHADRLRVDATHYYWGDGERRGELHELAIE
jgi:hypothetical protein